MHLFRSTGCRLSIDKSFHHAAKAAVIDFMDDENAGAEKRKHENGHKTWFDTYSYSFEASCSGIGKRRSLSALPATIPKRR
jgi:hypothetical protein